jgi:hypothetical protein
MKLPERLYSSFEAFCIKGSEIKLSSTTKIIKKQFFKRIFSFSIFSCLEKITQQQKNKKKTPYSTTIIFLYMIYKYRLILKSY